MQAEPPSPVAQAVPAGQDTPHPVSVPPSTAQAPTSQVLPVGHARPQMPQFSGSWAGSTQAPPQHSPPMPAGVVQRLPSPIVAQLGPPVLPEVEPDVAPVPAPEPDVPLVPLALEVVLAAAAVVVPTDVVPPLPEEQPANPTATSPATTPRDVRMRALV